MKKIINFLPFIALLAGFSLMADPLIKPEDKSQQPVAPKPQDMPNQAQATPAPTPAATEAPAPQQTLWDYRVDQLKAILSKAGVDQATSDKVIANLNTMKEENKARKEKAFTDAGLSAEQYKEVMAQVKERMKAFKEHVRQFLEMEKGAPNEGETPNAPDAPAAPAAPVEAAPAPQK